MFFNVNSLLQLKNYRFVTNPFLLKPLEERAYKCFDDLKNKSVVIRILDFVPIVNITDLNHVDIYLGLTSISNIIPIGTIVTHFYFPDIETLDDLLNLFVSKENINFEIGNTSSFLFKSENERLLEFIFMKTFIFQNHSSQGNNIKPNDRMFNILTPKYKMGRIYMAYQRENHFDSAEIMEFKNDECEILGTIKLKKPEKKRKSLFLLFSKNKKNRQNYEKLL